MNKNDESTANGLAQTTAAGQGTGPNSIVMGSPDEIVRSLGAIIDKHQVFEIRILNGVADDRRQPHTMSGYFDYAHIGELPKALAVVKSATGFYFTPNPVNPALLSRAANRLKAADRGGTTTDGEILRRLWFLVDCDPMRPSGVSATDDEHRLSEQRVSDVAVYLKGKMWPDPLVADSGNGFHLMYRIDLPAQDGGLVEHCLKALAARFNDEQIKVDTAVHNPARIWKLYGTVAAKGDHTSERPHRVAHMVMVPDSLLVVPRERLEALAADYHEPTPEITERKRVRNAGNGFDLDRWILDHDLVNLFGLGEWAVWRTAEGKEARRRVFKTCPWDPAHMNEAAFVIQFADGAIAAGCHHASCQGKDWHALRDVIEPGWREAREAVAGGGNERPRAADIIVELAITANVELFHSPGADAEPYVTIPVDGHNETYPLNGRRFKRWLGRLYYQETGSAPPAQAMEDAFAVLQGRALYDGPEHAVAVRVAEHEGTILIDLGDGSWKAVQVTPDGWQIIDPPVRFVRPRGLLPLPVPVRGGSVDSWRSLVNVRNDDDWALLCVCALSMFRPGRPFVILLVQGEQGSAKSTLCRQMRSLVDPNLAPLRSEPREVRDLVIAARNSLLQAFDNLSHVPPWLSDALCRMSTGGGFATRQLYEDDAEVIFDVKRPVLINGIDEVSTRSDLLDRMVTLALPSIEEGKRRAEADLNAEFELKRPGILGALLDGLSGALKNLPTVKLDDLPRMADFALFGVAAESALGLPTGSFIRAYRANRQGQHDVALEASPVVPALLTLMETQMSWSGVSRQLLRDLERPPCSDDRQRKQRGWPQNPRQLVSALKRLAPNFRAKGLDVIFGAHGRDGIRLIIRWTDGTSPSSCTAGQTSAPAASAAIPVMDSTACNGLPTQARHADIPFFQRDSGLVCDGDVRDDTPVVSQPRNFDPQGFLKELRSFGPTVQKSSLVGGEKDK